MSYSNSTIKRKEKPCKGTGKAKGYGCGKDSLHRKYGLCVPSCYSQWLLSTNEGQAHIDRNTIKGKQIVEKEANKAASERMENLRQEIKPESYIKKLQDSINELIRVIDHGNECISSGRHFRHNEKFDAGHFLRVSRNYNLRFHLFNIHAQSVGDNRDLDGNEAVYGIRLVDIFGQDYYDYIKSQQKNYNPNFTTKEIIELTKKTRSYVRALKKAKMSLNDFNKYQRIIYRRKYMKLLFNVEVPFFEIENN